MQLCLQHTFCICSGGVCVLWERGGVLLNGERDEVMEENSFAELKSQGGGTKWLRLMCIRHVM